MTDEDPQNKIKSIIIQSRNKDITLNNYLMKLRPYIVLGIALVSIIGCQNFGKTDFDKAKWNEQPDIGYTPPYRNRMLSDLIKNHRLKGLKYTEVMNLLGQPNAHDSASFSYDIIIEYGSDIDPEYVKNLKFEFSGDSIITGFYVEEWEKGKKVKPTASQNWQSK